MPSTFTPVLQLEKPGDGEQSGFWGSTVNANSDRTEAAILAAIAIDGGASVTPTPPTGARRITAPATGEILVEQFSGTVWTVLFDSRTKQSGGSSFLPLAGGTMTGAVVLAGNAAAPLNPVTLQQMQAADTAVANAANAAIAAAVSGGSPPGTVVMYGGATAPSGWLLCNGQPVSRTTFAALFAAIGVNFGGGDGTTTFNVPDMRGEFPRGHDAGRGIDAGRALGSAQAAELASHTHTITPTGLASASGNVGGGGGLIGVDTSAASGIAIGSTGGAETRPRNVTFTFIIRT